MSTHLNNSRIAKNTLFLYFRTFLILAVSLYTFRILLEKLGIVDYGIYNVVGGIVIFCSFLSNAIRQSTQRFITFYLGAGKVSQLGKVFSMSINVHFLVGMIVFILMETIGLWFLNYKLNIPQESHYAANVVFQLSIITFVIQLFIAPYQAVIMAYERFSFYAYFSIVEALLKLGAVLILDLFASNRLEIYSMSIMVATIIIWIGNFLYCKTNFKYCRYNFYWSKSLFKDFFSFSSWNIICGLSIIIMTQGTNMLFNIYCGVAVNAALGVANQVSNAINNFVVNFQTAFNPQIIKLYANKEYDKFSQLISRSSKFSLILILLFACPMIMCCNTILDLWLSDVPKFAVSFTKAILIYFIIDAISSPFDTAIQAFGRLKAYSIWTSIIRIANIPLACIILEYGFNPVYVIGLRILLNIISYGVKCFIVDKSTSFDGKRYCASVVIPGFLLIGLLFLTVSSTSSMIENRIISLVVTTVISTIVLFTISYFLLLDSHEKQFIINKYHMIRNRIL